MKIAMLILTLLLMVLPGQAQTKPKALVLPLNVASGFEGDADDQFTQILQKRLQQLSPGAEVQVARAAELTAYQFKADGETPPTLAQAETIARAYGSRYVFWTNIRFTPAYDKGTKCLSMGGAARLWVYDLERRQVTIDQPVSLLRTSPIKDIKNEAASRTQAQQLINGCINDLAIQILTISQERQAQAQAAAAKWNDTPSAPTVKLSNNYKSMVKAVKEYQRAAKNTSFFDLSSSQQNMNNLWILLTRAEQDKLAETYPGIVDMLNNQWRNAGGFGPYGGGYWPYYYPPAPIIFTP